MENETQKLIQAEKSLWSIIKGSIMGVDGEGSAKRATSFYTVMFLITGLDAAYIYGFYLSIHKLCSDEICTMIMKMFEPVLGIHITFVLVLLGLATIEGITNLWKIIKGQKTDDPK